MSKTDAIIILGHRLEPGCKPSEDLIRRTDSAADQLGRRTPIQSQPFLGKALNTIEHRHAVVFRYKSALALTTGQQTLFYQVQHRPPYRYTADAIDLAQLRLCGDHTAMGIFTATDPISQIFSDLVVQRFEGVAREYHFHPPFIAYSWIVS